MLGVVGGGQLGRMLALAGIPRGLQFTFLEPRPEAVRGLGRCLTAPYDDLPALQQLAWECDGVTFEFENVPAEAIQAVAEESHNRIWPPPRALQISQDRLLEKQLFQQLDIPTPDFRAVSTQAELEEAGLAIGYPAILKTRRFGYDGKGQLVLEKSVPLPSPELTYILEKRIAFERELSLVGVRSRTGQTLFYPLTENIHKEGVLRSSHWVAAEPDLLEQAHTHLKALMEELEYVGVLALELFEVDGQLLANEFAPRVHNTGHWTIEGAATSQFANHLRAILEEPLGLTDPLCPAGMLNCLGKLPDPARVLAVPGANLHVYGKTLRPGRKVGHVSLTAPNQATLKRRMAQVEKML